MTRSSDMSRMTVKRIIMLICAIALSITMISCACSAKQNTKRDDIDNAGGAPFATVNEEFRGAPSGSITADTPIITLQPQSTAAPAASYSPKSTSSGENSIVGFSTPPGTEKIVKSDSTSDYDSVSRPAQSPALSAAPSTSSVLGSAHAPSITEKPLSDGHGDENSAPPEAERAETPGLPSDHDGASEPTLSPIPSAATSATPAPVLANTPARTEKPHSDNHEGEDDEDF